MRLLTKKKELGSSAHLMSRPQPNWPQMSPWSASRWSKAFSSPASTRCSRVRKSSQRTVSTRLTCLSPVASRRISIKKTRTIKRCRQARRLKNLRAVKTRKSLLPPKRKKSPLLRKKLKCRRRFCYDSSPARLFWKNSCRNAIRKLYLQLLMTSRVFMSSRKTRHLS